MLSIVIVDDSQDDTHEDVQGDNDECDKEEGIPSCVIICRHPNIRIQLIL